jgi:hypothetical protein
MTISLHNDDHVNLQKTFSDVSRAAQSAVRVADSALRRGLVISLQ